MEKYGLLGLFLSTFASSTILPIPSELVVATFVALKYNLWLILFIASLGNVLGSITTYALGYFGITKLLQKMSKHNSARVRYFRQKSAQYGSILAFFSFLPFLGDIFTLALGLAKYNIYKAIFLIALGKTLRYAVIIFGVQEASKWFL
ncbi:YqaA family protein [Helicobacter kayseriensis]|uniref:YqaA family protein n=1 Tax=Helicobacter kayseriensis TaxID=2905877 RepID=UPI001E5ABD76|nr:YqaA family protein [Helicobacter kayseriensis]MCE3046550.1 DedA family protein [Helicobacter kayseriensis]MCE3048148.1 DedA family protein [Helicobacter kayseriensis]